MADGGAQPARIAVLSSAGGGGGGIAARRMTAALDARPDMTAEFLTAQDFGGYVPETVAPMRTMSNRRLTDTHYTLEYPGFRRPWLVDLLAGYDLVNIHWASYLIALAEIEALAARGTGVLFMLHDFHYITGGCHYPAGCAGLARGCTLCPQVDETACDASFVPINLRLKRRIFAREGVHLAAPSAFLRDQAVQSGIVPAARAHLLRNPYVPPAPVPEIGAAPRGPVRILLVADSLGERRKAVPLALDTLAALAGRGGPAFTVEIVGAADGPTKARIDAAGFPATAHGRITDHDRLSALFAGCDLLLTCSLEDNWPNILVEAGVFGVVPVVGPGHGCAEFVGRYGIGRVAPDYTAASFADTLAATIAAMPEPAARRAFAEAVRAEHRPEAVADRFAEIRAQIPHPAPAG